MDSHSILMISAVVLGVSGMLILLVGKHRTPAEGMQTVLHGTVPLIAAISYFSMAAGQGVVVLPADAAAGGTRLFYWARYADWSVTTPLLLLSLGLSGMHTTESRKWLLAGAVIADVLMIVTSFAFGASEVVWVKWTWFIISCAAFLGVYYVIWGPQLQASAETRDDVRAGYRRHAAILSVLWLIYPVILAVAPDGLNIVSDTMSVLFIAVLDIVSKVAYGFITIGADKSVTDRDLQVTPAVQTARQPAYAR